MKPIPLVCLFLLALTCTKALAHETPIALLTISERQTGLFKP